MVPFQIFYEEVKLSGIPEKTPLLFFDIMMRTGSSSLVDFSPLLSVFQTFSFTLCVSFKSFNANISHVVLKGLECRISKVTTWEVKLVKKWRKAIRMRTSADPAHHVLT